MTQGSTSLQPPYPAIAQAFQQGSVVPFLGAGVNFGHRTPPNAVFDPLAPTFLPMGAELSRYLADQVRFPHDNAYEMDDLARVSSYVVEALSRPDLRDYLRGIFCKSYDVCPIHAYLASVNTPLLIVTTNYDDLLEKAFQAANRPFDLVVHPTDRKDIEGSLLWWKHGAQTPEEVKPNKFHVDLATTTVIYKMHGTVHREDEQWDSYVITEDDYVDFLSRMTSQAAVPALFMRHFTTRRFLFLGYGLRDWNLRVVLRNMKNIMTSRGNGRGQEENRRSSWAIQFRPSELERMFWKDKQVNIYDVDLNEFVEQLRKL